VEVRLRLIIVDPPPGVLCRIQLGKTGRGDFLEPIHDTTFEFTLKVGPDKDGRPTLLGPCAQGPPAERFVYVNWGKSAGQGDSPWERRAKVPLKGITHENLAPLLEARIAGTGRDGGPCCATVRLLQEWAR